MTNEATDNAITQPDTSLAWQRYKEREPQTIKSFRCMASDIPVCGQRGGGDVRVNTRQSIADPFFRTSEFRRLRTAKFGYGSRISRLRPRVVTHHIL